VTVLSNNVKQSKTLPPSRLQPD